MTELPNWLVAVLGLSPAAIALFSVWLGRTMEARASEDLRKRSLLDGRNRQVAEALGRLEPILSDLLPDRLSINFDPSADPQPHSVAVTELRGLQRSLGIERAAHPSGDIREAIGSLQVDLNKTAHKTWLMLTELKDNHDWQEHREAANDQWERTNRSVEALIELLHAEGEAG